MKDKQKRTTSVFILFLLVLVITVIALPQSGGAEEGIKMRSSSDHIITGEMSGYSKKHIVVDSVRHRLCKDVMVFSPADTLIPLEDIDGAEEVKLYQNRRCVRKIKVMRFAQ